jgi:hypothetical protein
MSEALGVVKNLLTLFSLKSWTLSLGVVKTFLETIAIHVCHSKKKSHPFEYSKYWIHKKYCSYS